MNYLILVIGYKVVEVNFKKVSSERNILEFLYYVRF